MYPIYTFVKIQCLVFVRYRIKCYPIQSNPGDDIGKRLLDVFTSASSVRLRMKNVKGVFFFNVDHYCSDRISILYIMISFNHVYVVDTTTHESCPVIHTLV